ncbi:MULTISPECIES: trypsin-like serine peptidase [Flavobacterium]|uniref:trypsin-like serine peptidase n=1 Tax=Flavobacterium TaxID=237 RepID=UPI002114AA80|nr:MULTISPECIES: trypsin-like peptidase domain-containing protein [Flavobacterium]UUF13118.1 hypothetical protein NLJ00_17810 [Flavobacterium panici]
MGKKRSTENDNNLETVSNLDKEVQLKARSKQDRPNKGLMPAKGNFKHKFSDDLEARSTKRNEGFFKEYGDFSFPNDFPAKCVCLLLITVLEKDNKRQEYYGTGFMISPRIIITAGHNVFFGGKWADEIRALPGADGRNPPPYGLEIASELISTNNWVRNGSTDHDYGALILPSDNLFNRVKAYFQFFEVKQKGPIMIWGYPIKSKSKQVILHGVSSNIKPFIMEYELPTEKGNSGSPVFIVLNNEIVVVALHTMGGSPSSGVRVNPNVIKVWNAWINRPNILV